jgi:hypothetical protein
MLSSPCNWRHGRCPRALSARASNYSVRCAGQAPGPLRGPPTDAAPPTDDDAAAGPASFEIILPPVGDSTFAWFAVHPAASTSRADGCIAIIHNNRVLQTTRLSIDVGAWGDKGAGAVVTLEATIHPARRPHERREYDVAIQVSDVGGKLHLTVQREGIATPVLLMSSTNRSPRSAKR